MSPKDENKKPQPKHDFLDGMHFEPSVESTKNEPTPERVREEKERQSKK